MLFRAATRILPLLCMAPFLFQLRFKFRPKFGDCSFYQEQLDGVARKRRFTHHGDMGRRVYTDVFSVGERVSYVQNAGGCSRTQWALKGQNGATCTQRSEERLIPVEVVQAETVNAIAGASSAFAVPIGRVAAVATGSSAALETTKVVAEDIILNGQKVRNTRRA